MLRGIQGSAQVLRDIEALAIAHHGTVHWGQQNNMNEVVAQAMYPELAGWRAHSLTISGPQSRPQTFENGFCRQRGLTASLVCT